MAEWNKLYNIVLDFHETTDRKTTRSSFLKRLSDYGSDVSCVTCHVWRVMCDVSCVTCHVWRVMYRHTWCVIRVVYDKAYHISAYISYYICRGPVRPVRTWHIHLPMPHTSCANCMHAYMHANALHTCVQVRWRCARVWDVAVHCSVLQSVAVCSPFCFCQRATTRQRWRAGWGRWVCLLCLLVAQVTCLSLRLCSCLSIHIHANIHTYIYIASKHVRK